MTDDPCAWRVPFNELDLKHPNSMAAHLVCEQLMLLCRDLYVVREEIRLLERRREKAERRIAADLAQLEHLGCESSEVDMLRRHIESGMFNPCEANASYGALHSLDHPGWREAVRDERGDAKPKPRAPRKPAPRKARR
jgi:hypothetical protein